MVGPDVSAWQGVLIASGKDVISDSSFGGGTEKATIQWQLARGLTPDGLVGPSTRAHIMVQPSIIRVPIPGEPGAERWPFIPAQTWRWLDRKDIRLVVAHTMEAPEKPDVAEAVAAWFGGLRGPAPKASAHFCCDPLSGVRCVLARHGAAGAPGANTDGYHIEHDGFARQTAADWADDASTKILEISAEQAARVTSEYALPLRLLTVDQVRGGIEKGFCEHRTVSLAFKKSDHMDPGSFFPWDYYLGRVEAWQKKLAA
jgi:hypothetical protein